MGRAHHLVPMSQYLRFFQPGGTFFFTVVTEKRRLLLGLLGVRYVGNRGCFATWQRNKLTNRFDQIIGLLLQRNLWISAQTTQIGLYLLLLVVHFVNNSYQT